MNSKYLLAFLVAVAIGIWGYFGSKYYFAPAENSDCSAEELICPDGSIISRLGPSCQFEPCPRVGPDVTGDWLTATSTPGFTFRYPREFGLKYVKSVDWPPTLAVEDEPFTCVLPRNITGRLFCVRRTIENKVGSIYTGYDYSFALGESTAIFSTTFRSVQCENLSVTSTLECKQEELDFDIDSLMADMAYTIGPI